MTLGPPPDLSNSSAKPLDKQPAGCQSQKIAHRTCTTRSFPVVSTVLGRDADRAKNFESGPVWMPLSVASPYHLPAVKVKSPALPSEVFHLDLDQRSAQVAAACKEVVSGRNSHPGDGSATTAAAKGRPESPVSLRAPQRETHRRTSLRSGQSRRPTPPKPTRRSRVDSASWQCYGSAPVRQAGQVIGKEGARPRSTLHFFFCRSVL